MFHVIWMRFRVSIQILRDAALKVSVDSAKQGVDEPRLLEEVNKLSRQAGILACVCTALSIHKSQNRPTCLFGHQPHDNKSHLHTENNIKMC